jgi:signal-transduction protein with cAMP-binding, CBS, and nucleotidyltransferase domain
MTPTPGVAHPETTVEVAARMMRDLEVGAVPVVAGEQLLGVVTDRDLVLRVLAEGTAAPSSVRLDQILTADPITVSPDMQLSEARQLMARLQIRRLPVVKDGALVGIVSLGDIALADASERAVGAALGDISESPDGDMDQSPPMANPDRGTPQRVRSARNETTT